jgi:hypothetical protein
MRYNDKTPDNLEISVQVAGAGNQFYPTVSEDQCNADFKQLLDGCNVPADHNALNFKHGKLIQF